MKLEYVYLRYIAVLPVMWVLVVYVEAKYRIFGLLGLGEPKISSIWFDGLGRRNAEIKQNAKCFRSMDVIYDYHLAKTNYFDRFWIGMRNAQAVRNRRLVVKKSLIDQIMTEEDKNEIRILSLACGSGRDVIESLAAVRILGKNAIALLIDINPDALEEATNYAKKLGVTDQINTLQADIVTVWPEVKKFVPDIIHIVGLLEYVPNDKAINLLAAAHTALDGGTLIISHTVDNMEASFLRRVIGWDMIYRRAWQLESLLKAAGFKQVKIFDEPHKIQNIAVAK